MSQRVHVDANVILRFLRNDNAELSPMAAALFERAQAGSPELIVSPVTLGEVFYVLSSTYGVPRPEAAKALHALLSSDLLVCEDKGIAADALQRINANKDSFGDAYLVATAVRAQEELASFDRVVTGRKDVRVYPISSLMNAKGK